MYFEYMYYMDKLKETKGVINRFNFILNIPYGFGYNELKFKARVKDRDVIKFMDQTERTEKALLSAYRNTILRHRYADREITTADYYILDNDIKLNKIITVKELMLNYKRYVSEPYYSLFKD